MSEQEQPRKRARRKSTQPNSSTPTPPTGIYNSSALAATREAALTPSQKKMQTLLMQLVEKTTALTVKVAACKCNHKGECGVYQKAKEIAEIIDEIQELRAEVAA